jgi:hypothetical protein
MIKRIKFKEGDKVKFDHNIGIVRSILLDGIIGNIEWESDRESEEWYIDAFLLCDGEIN